VFEDVRKKRKKGWGFHRPGWGMERAQRRRSGAGRGSRTASGKRNEFVTGKRGRDCGKEERFRDRERDSEILPKIPLKILNIE